MSRIVKLNIGGVQYTTSVSTIAQYPESMLAVMIEKDNERQLIESGNELFVDRNGLVFKFVLEYLRNGNRLVLPRDQDTQRELALEAEFYQLDGLKRLVDETRKNRIVKLNVSGTRYDVAMSTIMQYPNSMLEIMIHQPHELQMIQDGMEIFIDRNGEMFKYVLEYLRDGGSFVLPDEDETSLKQLFLEAQFFMLEHLKAIIENKLRRLSNNGWKIGDVVTQDDIIHHVFGAALSRGSKGTIVQFRTERIAAVRLEHSNKGSSALFPINLKPKQP